MKFSHRRVALAAIMALVVAGCGSSGSDPKTGMISLGISDGPVHDVSKVCVAFNEIEFKSGADTITVEVTNNVNLLEFQGANAAPLLFNYELPAGDYQWIRLGVTANLLGNGGLGNDDTTPDCQGDESYIVMPEGVFNLYIPSGFKTGLKLVGGFSVPAGGRADFTAEFDLMKSVTAPKGLQPDVVLRPTIRLVNNATAGSLTGEVSSELATALDCDGSVYVFEEGVLPNELDEPGTLEPDPFDATATAMVNEQTNTQGEIEYHYTFGYLPAGDYVVAFTCDGVTFVPVDGKTVTIVEGETSVVNFP